MRPRDHRRVLESEVQQRALAMKARVYRSRRLPNAAPSASLGHDRVLSICVPLALIGVDQLLTKRAVLSP